MDLPMPIILKIIEIAGIAGVVLVLWWYDQRTTSRIIEDHRKESQATLETYRKDMQATLAAYRCDMEETRRMYESNVRLVEGYEGMARDLHDIVVLNVQKLTSMEKSILQNQYCPVVRVKKEHVEVETG